MVRRVKADDDSGESGLAQQRASSLLLLRLRGNIQPAALSDSHSAKRGVALPFERTAELGDLDGLLADGVEHGAVEALELGRR